MHQPIRDHLEAYLRDSNDENIPQEFHAHISACSSCADDLRSVTGHSRQLQAFRAPAQADLPAGFYARVLNRIEEQRAGSSIWSVFLEPTLGKRLAYACGALVLVLGTYLVSTEPGAPTTDPSYTQQVVLSNASASFDADGTVQPRDRDAVLVSLASFQE